jgi:hypothetical protein
MAEMRNEYILCSRAVDSPDWFVTAQYQSAETFEKNNVRHGAPGS